jgi:hypothetical protein
VNAAITTQTAAMKAADRALPTMKPGSVDTITKFLWKPRKALDGDARYDEPNCRTSRKR